jgi:hypothetical protein
VVHRYVGCQFAQRCNQQTKLDVCPVADAPNPTQDGVNSRFQVLPKRYAILRSATRRDQVDEKPGRQESRRREPDPHLTAIAGLELPHLPERSYRPLWRAFLHELSLARLCNMVCMARWHRGCLLWAFRQCFIDGRVHLGHIRHLRPAFRREHKDGWRLG